jgi:hypothetical protein
MMRLERLIASRPFSYGQVKQHNTHGAGSSPLSDYHVINNDYHKYVSMNNDWGPLRSTN